MVMLERPSVVNSALRRLVERAADEPRAAIA
jgi:hypothetical protein